MLRMSYIKSFTKEESMAVNKLCNIVENPDSKLISIRDFKIIILAINKIFFQWMTQEQKVKVSPAHCEREFGYFFEGRFYLNSREEIGSINQEFKLLYENKYSNDLGAI